MTEASLFEEIKHKGYRLNLSDNMIQVTAIGSWGEHTCSDFVKDFKSFGKRFNQQPWASLLYLENWQLGTPSIESDILQLTHWGIAHGMCRAALVLPSNPLVSYQIDKLVVRKAEGFQRQDFSDSINARTWLAQQGY